MRKRTVCIIGLLALFALTGANAQWNNPHRSNGANNTVHSAFTEAPKTLDPARAYSSNEFVFIANIYEPPLQYHYLKRPYTLVPLTTSVMPEVTFYDKKMRRLPDNTDPNTVAYTVYDIYIRPGIYYQPHPAFAKNKAGKHRYFHLTEDDIDDINTLNDFKHTGTRELTAADYVYQIKRLASPELQSPILGVMIKHIVGLKQLNKTLSKAYDTLKTDNNETPYLDLRQFPLKGAKVIGKYHYQIKLKGVYRQFVYWLAMPFFSPIPWEVDYFYSQPGMLDKNLTLNWYPVGTGPYMLIENNPNKQMVLVTNPNFRGEQYPHEGEPSDRAKGYLQDAGQSLPFVKKFIVTLDKESIPRWNKFLQGYYDKSGVSGESFDQAIKIDKNGQAILTEPMKKKGIQLTTTVAPSTYYIGFNMLDEVVGGYGPKKQKLRQAISIALDYEEYISIFLNGRGIAAHGPIPPGIFGYKKDQINEFVYNWNNGKAKRKSLAVAKKLLMQAGYPGGINPKTHKPLVIHYDATSGGGPDEKARFEWMRKQLAKIGIQLNVRATTYNRFQEKVLKGNVQLFSWGWNADYPDPENFLFLLYGPNGKVKHGGENAANYNNPTLNQLFKDIRSMPNGPERQAKITEATKILQKDSPWIWGFHPIFFTLSHQWNRPTKPHALSSNTLKYERLNNQKRHKLQAQWNKPTLWPLWVLLFFLLLIAVPLAITYWKRENQPNINKE